MSHKDHSDDPTSRHCQEQQQRYDGDAGVAPQCCCHSLHGTNITMRCMNMNMKCASPEARSNTMQGAAGLSLEERAAACNCAATNGCIQRYQLGASSRSTTAGWKLANCNVGEMKLQQPKSSCTQATQQLPMRNGRTHRRCSAGVWCIAHETPARGDDATATAPRLPQSHTQSLRKQARHGRQGCPYSCCSSLGYALQKAGDLSTPITTTPTTDYY